MASTKAVALGSEGKTLKEDKIVSSKNGNAAAKALRAQAIWDKRVMGYSVDEISEETGLSKEKVQELLESYHTSLAHEGIEFYRRLALSRIEALIRVYLPMALCAQGRAKPDAEHSLRCACLILSCLKLQSDSLVSRSPNL